MKHRTSCWLVFSLLLAMSGAVRAQNPFDVPTLPALPVIVDTQPSPMQPNPLYPFPMPANPLSPNPAYMPAMPPSAPYPGPVMQGPVFASPQIQYPIPVNQAPAYAPQAPMNEPATPNPGPVVAPAPSAPVARPIYAPSQSAECCGQVLPESLPKSQAGSNHPCLDQIRRLLNPPAHHGPAAEPVELSRQVPMTPVEITAARIRLDESTVERRRAAVRYLGRIECQFNPEAEEALVDSLRSDRSEIVRFEAALALSNSCCSTKRILEALHTAATGGSKDGHPPETSERVRWAALEALHRNTQPGHTNTAPPQELPPPTLVPTGLRQVTSNYTPAKKATPNGGVASKSQSDGLLPILQGGKTTAPTRPLPTLTPIGPIPPQYQPQPPVYQPTPVYPPPQIGYGERPPGS